MATKSEGATMLGIRLDPEDMKRLEALAERIPVATKHGIARAALLIGLEAIEKDPTVLLGKPARKGKR